MEKGKDNKETVKKIFTDYLSSHKCRKTPERYAILDIIYSESKHFSMETLAEAMIEHNFRVSRATLYNTMQLLLKCNLVLKHQFGKNISYYERAYKNESHNHLICTSCGKIQEFTNENLSQIIKDTKYKRFYLSNYSLNIYGLCSKCRNALNKNKGQIKNQKK